MFERNILRATCIAGLLASAAAFGQSHECASIAPDADRLACYDRIFGHADEAKTKSSDATLRQPRSDHAMQFLGPGESASSMEQRWELEPRYAQDRFVPRVYKPVYFLPFSYANRSNNFPSSPSAGHQPDGSADLSLTEAKFQLSMKTKIWGDLFGEGSGIWAAYTQSSRWQLYNDKLSRPFRETNYEPELIAVFRTRYELWGWQGKMAAISLNHQSNGRALPLSRSWNRVIGEVGLERGRVGLSLRAWWRIPESASDDDNPDIGDYFGRGEMLLTYASAYHVLSLQARHSLRFGDRSRGSLQIEWAFPLYGNLHGYLQLFSGYGESMIDYNFRQNRAGLGISLVEWR